MSSNSYPILAEVIIRMRDGDIGSFIIARRLMDDMNFIELSGDISQKNFSAFFLGRCFLEQVISNLAADSMFEFPPHGTQLEKLFKELSSNTGKFLYEFIIDNGENYSAGMEYLSHAIGLYYEYLRILNTVGSSSDLGNQTSIWQLEEAERADL